jgi:acyl-CoA synthetase (AMP-forming)/AMP-acid ligase II
VGRTLRAMRIGRRDRVAVVLPNGPEMAVAFLAILIFNRPRRHFRS